MMAADIGLGLSVVAAGLWSGLLLTLTTILHPMFAQRDGDGFLADMRRFLPIARRSPTNYVLVLALIGAPILALIGLGDMPGSAPFVLTAVGLGATVAGPLLTSALLAEPNYAVILGWRPGALPPNWRAVRTRYYLLNWIRAVLTWTALAAFLTAAYLHLT